MRFLICVKTLKNLSFRNRGSIIFQESCQLFHLKYYWIENNPLLLLVLYIMLCRCSHSAFTETLFVSLSLLFLFCRDLLYKNGRESL